MSVFYSIDQVAELAYAAGFRGSALQIAVAVSKAEDGNGQNDRVNTSGNKPPSRDRGLWMINDHYHPEVSDAQAFDGLQNAKAAYRISSGGSSWKPWSTFNGGQYKKFMDAAKVAADKVTAAGGSAGTAASSGSTATTTVTGERRGVTKFPITALAPEPLVPRSAGDLQILGSSLRTLLGQFAVTGSIEMQAAEIPAISISLLDPQLQIIGQPWLRKFVDATWNEWRLTVAEIDIDDNAGVPQVTMGLWPRGVDRMKSTAAKSFSNMTPGEYASRGFGEHGIYLENYEGVADVGSFGPSTDGGTTETWWEVIKRVADEKGFVFWVTPECRAIWGKPTIITQALARYDVGWNRAVAGDNNGAFDAIGFPHGHTWVNTSNPNAFDGDTVDLQLARWRGERIRPGMGQSLWGVPKFGGRKMVTKVSWKLDEGLTPVEITAQDPSDPKPTTSTSSAPAPQPLGASTQAGTATSGTKQAGDFVQFALNQAGDKYIFGATPKSTDKDPSAFDCSSLVQWAAAQVGITMPRNSNAQYSACIKKSVSEAAAIRGALLFRPPGTLGASDSGHVVISLGDGKTTIEAMGSAYGVRQGTVGNRFKQGGLIPGMVYR